MSTTQPASATSPTDNPFSDRNAVLPSSNSLRGTADLVATAAQDAATDARQGVSEVATETKQAVKEADVPGQTASVAQQVKQAVVEEVDASKRALQDSNLQEKTNQAQAQLSSAARETREAVSEEVNEAQRALENTNIQGQAENLQNKAASAAQEVKQAVQEEVDEVKRAVQNTDFKGKANEAQAQASATAQDVKETTVAEVSALTSALPSLAQVQASVTSAAQQVAASLPASVAAYLPASLTSGGAAGGTTAPAVSTADAPAGASHHSQLPLTSESRETTSAPLEGSAGDRPTGTVKPLVAPASTGSTGPSSDTMKAGVVGDSKIDITQPHTTGTFQATGNLQSTKNPEIVGAQSNLAARAETGDL